MLPLTLASKSCCHHKPIYSSPPQQAPSPLHCFSYSTSYQLSSRVCERARRADEPLYTRNNRGALVFCHPKSCAAQWTNRITRLGFDLCFQALWFCWAKQLAAPHSASVPQWEDGVIIFCRSSFEVSPQLSLPHAKTNLVLAPCFQEPRWTKCIRSFNIRVLGVSTLTQQKQRTHKASVISSSAPWEALMLSALSLNSHVPNNDYSCHHGNKSALCRIV